MKVPVPSVGFDRADRPTTLVPYGTSAQPALIGPSSDASPIAFICDPTSNCPEITVDGDPDQHACLEVFGKFFFKTCPTRGLRDASLAHDPESGDLLMAYGYESLDSIGPIGRNTIRNRHDIHLARSSDNGLTWRLVFSVNEARRYRLDDVGTDLLAHQAPSLDRLPNGDWALLWQLSFMDGLEKAIVGRLADAPLSFNDNRPKSLLSGSVRPANWAPPGEGDRGLPELDDCDQLAEPALLSDGDDILVAVECIGRHSEALPEDYARSGIDLLRWDGQADFEYLGRLLSYDDARQAVGGASVAARFTQVSLAKSRVPGRLLLLVTPADVEQEPQFHGCLVYEIADKQTARVRRSSDGRPRLLAEIRRSEPWPAGEGAGGCGYHSESETGIILTLASEDDSFDPKDKRFSLHATGVHP